MKTQTQTATARNGSSRKLFYRINEVATMTGLKPYVLRYWESEFAELRPEKDSSDQRRYRQKDINTILAIRKLLYEDRFTIKGARKKVKQELRNGSGGAGTLETAKTGARSARPVRRQNGKLPSDSLGQKLFHLRSEVSQLLKILDA